MPPLDLGRLDGAGFTLAEAAGRPVLVHFFATWCPPCVTELPALDRLAARREGQPLAMLLVSVAEVDAAVRRFLTSRPTTLPVLMDRDRAAARAWGVTTLPTTILLDATHARAFLAEGEVDWNAESVNAVLDRLVGAATVPAGEEDDEPT